MPIKSDDMPIGTDGNMEFSAGTEALLEVPLLPDEIIWKKKSELLGACAVKTRSDENIFSN